MFVIPIALAALAAAGTVAHVYRGGTTLNDHAVAAMVTGCVGVYPVLWVGAVLSGVSGAALVALGAVLAFGCAGIYGLFFVLDLRRDPGPLIWWARSSQLCYSFSLWAGLLIWVRAPVVVAIDGLHLGALCWPGAWLLLPLGLAGWGTVWTFWKGDTERVFPVPLGALRGREVRVVHLSDLHVGPTFRRADMVRLVAQTNALRPDLVVITGDLLMPFSEREHDFLIDALQGIEAPAFACAGNHDLPVLEAFRAELAAIGVPMLVDEARVIDVRGVAIEVAGVNFHWKGARERLEEALAGLPDRDADAALLLAHDPRLFAWLPPDRFDLVLSGHTHGGQVGTDMFGLPWSVLRPFGVHDQGWWARGRARQYVHRGNWKAGLPPRMGIAGEVVVHVLGAEDDPRLGVTQS